MRSLGSSAWRGWASILGGALINISCGALYCFGQLVVMKGWNVALVTFQATLSAGNTAPYIVSYIRKYGRESNLTYQMPIVCTGVLFAMNSVGIAAGSWVEGRLGVKRTLLCGCLLSGFGIVTSFWAVQCSFYLLVVTYGVVFGISTGWLFYPTLLSGMRWFPKKRGLVSGVLMASYGLGALMLNFIQTLFINPTNLSPNDVKVVGERKETYYTQESVLRRTPSLFLLQAGLSVFLQITGLLLQHDPEAYHHDTEMQSLLETDEKGLVWDDSIEQESSPDHYEIIEDKYVRNTGSAREGHDGTSSDTHHQGVVPGEGLESTRRDPLWSGLSLSVGQVIRQPAIWQFMLISAAVTCTGIAFIGSYKAFGFGFIRDDFFLAGTGSVSAVCNFLGHAMTGIVTDHISTKVTAILLSASMSFLLLVVSATSLGGKAPFFIVVCGVFFMEGGIFAIQPVFVIRAYGERHFAANYSLAMLLGVCVPNILGTMIVFVQPNLSWSTMYICFGIISGISMIAGMFMNVKNQQGNDV